VPRRAVHREREFTNYVTSTIFCGTYNVNAKVIADEDVNNLEEWLFGKDEPMADIYAVVSTTHTYYIYRSHIYIHG
jgi:hypothetical protein